MTAKMAIRRMASNLMSAFGIHSLVEHFCCSGKTFVLMYHRVLSSPEDLPYFVQPGMYVDATTFERHIIFLKDRFKITFLADLVEKVLNGEDIGGSCAITFDDGWRDNYTDAYPILLKYRVPATIFLATGFVGTDKVFWPEEICHYLGQNMANKSEYCTAPLSYLRLNEEICKYRQCKRETFFERSIEILKGCPPRDREEILEYFRATFKTNPFPRQMLSWDEAREMQASGLIRFGAHTVNHEILDQISLLKAKEEICNSREELERQMGSTVKTFAYPNGNHSDSIRMFLKESGLNIAVTTHKGFFERGMSSLQIPRIAIHEDVSNTISMFRSRILFAKF